MDAVLRILRWAILVGGIGFVLGFFGPMLLAPDANQGPMLGIFITGPLGAVLGAGYGIWHELRRRGGEAPAPAPAWVHPVLRGGAMFLAAVLVLNGVSGLMFGAWLGGAIAVALGLAVGWWGWTGGRPRRAGSGGER